MNSHTFFRLLRWPRPLLTLAAALITIVLGLQGVPFNRLPSATATVPSASQQPHEPLLAQSNTGPTLLKQGQDYYNAGQYTDAAATWERAEQYFLTQGDTLNRAIALSNRALAYRQLGRIADGVNAAQTSVGLLTTMNSQTAQGLRIYGQAFNTQGSLYLAQGKTHDALKAWEQATEQYQKADYPTGTVKSLLYQAQALRSLGFFRRSSVRISQAQTLLAGQSDSSLKAELFNSLGNAQRRLGDLDDSEQSLKAGLKIAESLSSVPDNLINNLITKLYLSLGNTQHVKARQQASLAQRINKRSAQKSPYQAALKSYQTISNNAPTLTGVHSQLNQLAIFIELGDWDNAQTLYTALPGQIESLPLGRSSAFARLTLARLLLDVKNDCRKQVCPKPGTLSNLSRQIYTLLTGVQEQNQLLSDPVIQSYALGYLGHLYEIEKDQVTARQLTEQALESVDQPAVTYQWQWQLGRLANDSQQELAYYDNAFENIRRVREDLLYVSPDARFDFRDRIEPFYRQYLNLLLPAPPNADIQDANKLALAQTVIDDLRVAELQAFLACGLFDPEDTQSVAKIQDIADQDGQTAIIYPIILDDRLEVLTRLPGQVNQTLPSIERYTVPFSSLAQTSCPNSAGAQSINILECKLTEFRKELEQPYFSTLRGQPLAKEIYGWLIRPMESLLAQNNIETLIFVLDGPFRNVPMAALSDGGQFLIEKYAIAVTFGDLEIPKEAPTKDFHVLAAGLSADPQPLQSNNRLPATNQPASQSLRTSNITANQLRPTEPDFFGPLTYVQDELENIEALISKTTLLEDRSFTKTGMQNTMRSSDYNVVHLATHGEFGYTRDNTFLLAAADSQANNDGINATKINLNTFDALLTTRDGTPLQLLTLSACETAEGDDREVLGIAGLAVQTGARSTLATLWSISDLSTAVLMNKFYDELSAPNVTKAQALRQAQMELLNKGYAPSKWGPYLMVGDWR